MRTKLLEGVDPRDDDEDLIAALFGEARRDNVQAPMVVGIRNRAGDLYRIVHTSGLAEFIGVTRTLRSRGFFDEIGSQAKVHQGCDAVFVESQDGTA